MYGLKPVPFVETHSGAKQAAEKLAKLAEITLRASLGG